MILVHEIVANLKDIGTQSWVHDCLDIGIRSFRSYQHDRVVLFKRWKKCFKFKLS